MGKTLAIIELYQHDEVLKHYCEMLMDSEYDVQIYCSEHVYRELEAFHGFFNHFVMKAQESIPSFLEQHLNSITSADLVFLCTIQSDFKSFFELIDQSNALLMVHNINSIFLPEQSLVMSRAIDWIRHQKAKWHKTHYYKMKIQESLKAIALPNDMLYSYMKENVKIPSGLNCYTLPFAYYNSERHQPSQSLTITVPGTLNQTLRDYDILLRALTCIQNRIKTKLRLVLLGMPKRGGKKIQSAFAGLVSQYIEVIVFDAFIPTEEYDRYLSSSSFLILPIRKYVVNQRYKEHLGQSKISGGINDMIRFGIPSILPAYYHLDGALKDLTAQYGNQEELQDILLEWIEHKTYLQKSEMKEKALADYLKPVIKQSFLRTINSIM